MKIQTLFTEMILIKLVFNNDMAYGESKDLTKWTQSEKVLRDEAFEIASSKMGWL